MASEDVWWWREEKEGRDNQGCRGPGRIRRLCELVDLKEQFGHTSVLLEECGNQGEVDDAERTTGCPRSSERCVEIQATHETFWSLPGGTDLCFRWPEARVGRWREEQRTMGKLQMKSLLGGALPAFPNPILLLGCLALDPPSPQCSFVSLAYFLSLLSDNY